MIREFGLIDIMYLLGAARWTVALAAVAFLGGGLAGLLIALLRVTPFAPVRWLAIVYVQAIQGTPLLAWLFLFYFGLPLVGVGAVALEAVVRQDRADLAVEVDLRGPRGETDQDDRRDEPGPRVEPEPATSHRSWAFLLFGRRRDVHGGRRAGTG